MPGKLTIIAVLVAMAITSTVAGMNNPVAGVKEMYPTKEQHPKCRQFGRPHHPRRR
jgi:hypothetical protein